MNSDFKDLLSLLAQHEVKFFVVGGYAVMLYGEPRHTKDIAIAVESDNSSIMRVRAALEAFGFPMPDEAASELAKPNKMMELTSAMHGVVESFEILGELPFRLSALKI